MSLLPYVFILTAAMALLSAESKPLIQDNLKIIAPQTSSNRNSEKYRLPKTSIPKSYKISLTIDPNQQDSFLGSVVIKTEAISSVDEIVIHLNRIEWITISVIDTSTMSNIFNSSTQAYDDRHFFIMKLNKKMVPSQIYEIRIVYNGMFGKNMHGLYLSSYEVNGAKRFLATTQFESTYAREAFPCFDEPGLKATFQLRIDCPKTFDVISNTELVQNGSSALGEKWHSFEFAPTPKMSTYLIAFVVSDFQFMSNILQGPQSYPKEVRSYARPSATDDLAFSLKVSQDSLKWLETFTKVKFPIAKMDNVAIPDFSAGAMENWGLVTYREEYLLQKDGATTTRNVMNIATVISHENAHQWFGNEVSPLWWEYTWLSEGFATYFEYHTTDKILDGWRLADQFVTNFVQLALRVDGLVSTNAMSNPVGSPSEIENQFNTIAYQKAGSVIRMIQHVIGMDNFQEGLTSYLLAIPRGSGEPKILFSNLDKVIAGKNILPEGVTIDQIFSSWADQKGFPLVTAARTANGTIAVTQKRYYQNSSLTSDEEWWVPINVVKESEPNFTDTKPSDWLVPKTPLALTVPNAEKWFILNKQQTGYYRVMYDDTNWILLGKALNTSDYGKIHLLNRAQLVDDIFEFAKTNRLNYNITFNLVSYLAHEVDYVPWVAANNGLLFLSTRMQGTKNYKYLEAFAQQLNKKVYTEVGFQVNSTDTPITKLNRILALSIACNMGSKDCRTKAGEKLKEQMNSIKGEMVDPDLRQVVYCSAVRDKAAKSEWEYLLNELKNTTLAPEITLLLTALGCTENTDLINRYLMYSIEGTEVRDQDRHLVVESVINAGETGFPLALKFVNTNFRRLKKKVTSMTGITRIINALGNRLVTAEDLTVFEAFTTEYSAIFTAGEKAAVDRALETAHANRQWLATTIDEVDSWLLENVTLGATSNVVSFTLLALCLTVVRYFTQ